MVFAGILCSLDHALNAAVAETARHDDAVHICKGLPAGGLIGQVLTLHPADLYLTVVLKTGVIQAFHHREVSIMQLDVLAHQCNAAGLAAGGNAGHHLLPLGQVGRRNVQLEFLHHDLVQTTGVQHQRALVQAGHGQVLDHTLRLHIAEGADLAADIAAHAAVRTQDDNVGVHTHALQLFHRVLCGLGFVLVRAGNVGHQHHMDVAAVVTALLQTHLTDGLEEGLAFDITGRAANLGNDHVSLGGGSQIVDITLDLVGDVGDDLHGLAQVCTLTFLVQHVPVHLAGGQVGVFVQVLVDEALVVAKIQIGLGTVIRHEHFAVLQRAHGTRVYVHIGVQLLAGHLQTAALEQTAQRCGRDALAQTGNDTAGDKDEFGLFLCHRISSSIFAFLNSFPYKPL